MTETSFSKRSSQTQSANQKINFYDIRMNENSLSMTREKQKLLSNSVDLFQQQNYYIADKIHSIFYFNLTRNKNVSRKQHRKRKSTETLSPFFLQYYIKDLCRKKNLSVHLDHKKVCA